MENMESELGQNAPFPPSPPSPSNPSSALAIISLVLGIFAVILIIPAVIFPFIGPLCGIVPFIMGLAGVIIGLLGRSRAANSPNQYSGKDMATLGIFLGALGLLAPFVAIAWWILSLLYVVVSGSRSLQ